MLLLFASQNLHNTVAQSSFLFEALFTALYHYMVTRDVRSGEAGEAVSPCRIVQRKTKIKYIIKIKYRSYRADLKHKVFFHGCEVALTSHICFPIRLVFHQHLNSHVAYPGIPPEPSNHTRGPFLHLLSYPLLRVL